MKKMLILVTLIIIFLAIVAIVYMDNKLNKSPRLVSMINILAHPRSYHGKAIITCGVSRVEFESNAIHLTKECYDNHIWVNSLWLDLGDSSKSYKEFDGKYVVVEGVFNYKNKGHMGVFPGAIEKITRFELWTQRL